MYVGQVSSLFSGLAVINGYFGIHFYTTHVRQGVNFICLRHCDTRSVFHDALLNSVFYLYSPESART